MKNKKTLLIVSVLLLVCVLSLSYAYFTSQNDIGELENNKLEEQTANLNGTIVTLAGERLKAESTNVYPGHKEIIKLTVSALHDNGPVNYNLEWVGKNTLTSEVTYKIYKSEEDLEPTITCETKTIPSESMIQYYEECKISNFGTLENDETYQEGTIIYSEIEETQTLLYKEEITGEDPAKLVYYYVVIEYPNDPKNSQDNDATHGYNGHFKLNNINDGTKFKKVNTSIGVLDVNLDKPNFSNRSCLNGTQSSAHNGGDCEEETNGIYEETTSLGKTYYYRGTVNNNWVKYGTSEDDLPMWWRIIRVNEDRTIRLIYAGEGNDAPASTDQIGGQAGYWMSNSWGINNTSYAFNSSTDSNAYVGYMYGTPGSETFEAEHGYDLIDSDDVDKLQDSDVKDVIDEWYFKNLQDEGNVLSGSTGFCGDRGLEPNYEGKGYANLVSRYRARYRIVSNKNPSFECEDSAHDLYTTSNDEGAGNGALDYPVGLITIDEASYAGGLAWVNSGVTNANYGYWLRTGKVSWTLSPSSNNGGSNASVLVVYDAGYLGGIIIANLYGIRPVVNVKPEYFNTEGKAGTIENPYVVSSN